MSVDPDAEARPSAHLGSRPDRSRLVATVHGSVQGVGFRVFVQRHANALALDGWVANRSDGSVEVVAEGPPADLDRLVARLREGPRGAAVRGVDVRMDPARGGDRGFIIRTGHHRGD